MAGVGSVARKGDLGQLSHCLLGRQIPEGKKVPTNSSRKAKFLYIFGKKIHIRILKRPLRWAKALFSWRLKSSPPCPALTTLAFSKVPSRLQASSLYPSETCSQGQALKRGEGGHTWGLQSRNGGPPSTLPGLTECMCVTAWGSAVPTQTPYRKKGRTVLSGKSLTPYTLKLNLILLDPCAV